MEYKLGILLGRLTNGFQSDHGLKVHAVVLKKCKRPPCPYNDFGRKEMPDDDYSANVGLCGTQPGRKSVGWSYDSDLKEVTCPKCLAKLSKGSK